MDRDISNNTNLLFRNFAHYLNNLIDGTNNISNDNTYITTNLTTPVSTDISNNHVNIIQNPNVDRFNLLNTNPQQLNNVYSDFLENFVMSSRFTFSDTQNEFNALLRETLQQKNNYKHVLSEKGKQEIKTELYSKEKFPEQKCCPISRKKFVENETISKLPCNHIFDPEMILQWLENENASCPVCRHKLDSVEKKIIDSENIDEEEEDIDSGAVDTGEDTDTHADLGTDENSETDEVIINGNTESTDVEYPSLSQNTHTQNIIHPIPITRTARMTQQEARDILRNSINNLLIQEQEKQEEEDLQAAIMASLNDVD
jgi:hypothetical protein